MRFNTALVHKYIYRVCSNVALVSVFDCKVSDTFNNCSNCSTCQDANRDANTFTISTCQDANRDANTGNIKTYINCETRLIRVKKNTFKYKFQIMGEPLSAICSIGFLGANSIIFFQKKLKDLSDEKIKMRMEYRKLYLEHYGVILLAENVQNFIQKQNLSTIPEALQSALQSLKKTLSHLYDQNVYTDSDDDYCNKNTFKKFQKNQDKINELREIIQRANQCTELIQADKQDNLCEKVKQSANLIQDIDNDISKLSTFVFDSLPSKLDAISYQNTEIMGKLKELESKKRKADESISVLPTIITDSPNKNRKFVDQCAQMFQGFRNAFGSKDDSFLKVFKSLNEHGEFTGKEEIVDNVWAMVKEETDVYSVRERMLSEFGDTGIIRKKSYILLLGPSKSGKTTTLDTLIFVGEIKHNYSNPELSETIEIRERVYRYESELKDENNKPYFIEVSLLDFPGFFDNRGEKHVTENYKKIFGAICKVYNDIICIIFCMKKDLPIGTSYFVEELKYFKSQLQLIKEKVGSDKEVWKKTMVLLTKANAESDDVYNDYAMKQLKYDDSMSLTEEQYKQMMEVAWKKEIEEKSREWQAVFMQHMDVTPLVQPIENSTRLRYPFCKVTKSVILRDGSRSNEGFWKCIKKSLSSHSQIDLISTLLCLYPPKPEGDNMTSDGNETEVKKEQMKRTIDRAFNAEKTWGQFFGSFCTVM